IPGGVDAAAALPGANSGDTRRAAGKVGEIDPVGRGGELLVLDDLEVGEIVDQRQQVLAGVRNVRRVIAVFLGQWPGELRPDGLGIGYDTRDGLPQYRRDFAADRRAEGRARRLHRLGGRGGTEHLFGHEVQFVTIVARLGLSEWNEMRLPVALRAFDPQPR